MERYFRSNKPRPAPYPKNVNTPCSGNMNLQNNLYYETDSGRYVQNVNEKILVGQELNRPYGEPQYPFPTGNKNGGFNNNYRCMQNYEGINQYADENDMNINNFSNLNFSYENNNGGSYNTMENKMNASMQMNPTYMSQVLSHHYPAPPQHFGSQGVVNHQPHHLHQAMVRMEVSMHAKDTQDVEVARKKLTDNLPPKTRGAALQKMDKTISTDQLAVKKKVLSSNDIQLPKTEAKPSYKAVLDRQRAVHAPGLRVFTGTVEKVLKWHKALQEMGADALFEVIAKCISTRAGAAGPCSQQLLLRDSSGPILQATFMEIDFLMPRIPPGTTVRVVGKMVGSNRMKAVKVREAAAFELATLPRLGAISQHVVAKMQANTAHN